MPPVPPCPAPARWWQSWTSGLLLCWQLCLGAYLVFFFFFFFFFTSQFCCPLRFQNSPQTQLWEGFLLFGNFSSFMTPSPGQVSIPNSFVSIFVFYILSYLLLKRMGCPSGCLVSSTSIQKLFCGSCSAFKWSLGEFVGFCHLQTGEQWFPSFRIFFLFFGCGLFLKSLLNLLQCCFCFMFWYFGPEACGVFASQPGIEPELLALEGKVLTTGTQGSPR